MPSKKSPVSIVPPQEGSAALISESLVLMPSRYVRRMQPEAYRQAVAAVSKRRAERLRSPDSYREYAKMLLGHLIAIVEEKHVASDS